MGKKYCDKCMSPVEMSIFECPACRSSSFLHSLPDFCLCETPDIYGGICTKCSKEVNSPKSQMPQAKREGGTTGGSENLMAASNNSDYLSQNLNSKSGKNIDDLIRAQNKTTHAVRAFVRFLFIQLCGDTIALILWNLSTSSVDQQKCFQDGTNCTGNAFLQFLSAGVLIVGVIWSSQVGWDELSKSNID